LEKILGLSEGNRNLLPLLDIDLHKNSEKRKKVLDNLENVIHNLIFPGGNISYSSYDGLGTFPIIHSSYGGTETFPYIIKEIIKNVNQHSRANKVYSYSQIYPNKDYIDVGILDNGDTIPGKYEQSQDGFCNENGINPYEFENDCEAIFRSLNGISTNEEFKRSIKISRTEVDILNSGYLSFGINSSIRLVTEGLGGSFLIASREGICHLTKRKAKFKSVEYDPIKGTFVCIRFKRESLYPEEFEKIRDNHDLINDEEGKYKLISKKT
jgi:hypothetical protein